LRVVRQPRFRDDYSDAYAWIAADSQSSAERLLDRVEATIEFLQLYPMTGALRERLGPDLRSIRVRPFSYLIFYRVNKDELVLIRLLHGARALEEQDYKP
jgi:toxin ParE1/3/4